MPKISRKITRARSIAQTPAQKISLSALRSLSSWFLRQKRVLPWREHPDLYSVWISEIMLQQTQVSTVIPYFEKWMKKFPRVEDLARAPLTSVLKAWAGLGYYSRAKNIHIASKSILQQGWPKNREEWLALPGVGPYTAGAILSIAQNQPEPMVDGNVERVFSRLKKLSRAYLGEKKYRDVIWRLSEEMILKADQNQLPPSQVNQAWMELGALICTPKNPQCPSCPLQKECEAFQSQEVHMYPTRKRPKEWIEIKEKRIALLSFDGKKVLLEKNREGEWRAGLWDFPKTIRLHQAKKINHFNSTHVVTRHKIGRSTECFVLGALKNQVRAFQKVVVFQKAKKQELKWVSLRDPEVPLSAPAARGLDQIRKSLESPLFLNDFE